MILKASKRGGAAQLGSHLLKAENEHVEVHEIRGFIADELKGAMKEMQSVARGTRCKQFMFSVSLNPPETEAVAIDLFEAALDRIERSTGLSGQPRVVVFHEKQGRRHCHAVWSRIDIETMTAKPLPFFKMKLRQISKELYLENGWLMPRGLMDTDARDPRNFSLAEWQQAKRACRDPRQIRAALQECWSVSDNHHVFLAALNERGLHLARGDRGGHVAVTYEGDVFSVARVVGKKAKEVAARLGDAKDLLSVAETRANIAREISPKLAMFMQVADLAQAQDLAPIETRRIQMVKQHKFERHRLDEGQRARAITEARERHSRLRKGVKGVWDRLTGRYARIRLQNEAETVQGFIRDREQRNLLVRHQLEERRQLQEKIRAVRHRHSAILLELHRDLGKQTELARVTSMESLESRSSERRHGGVPRPRGFDLSM